MEPYVHEDDNGNTLKIDCGGFYAEVEVDSADGPFRVFPEDLPKITRELYEAAGQSPPVILRCPPLPEHGEWSPAPDSLLRVRRDRNRLTVRTTMDGGAAVLDPAAARAMAAVLATLADEAEAEPDPELIRELAREIHKTSRTAGFSPDPTAEDAVVARTALRWMNAKRKHA